MSWHKGRLCLIDAETTGTDPHRDRIVTFAVVAAGDGEATEAQEWLLKPGIEIPQSATDVHGISTEQARAEGRGPGDALPEIAAEILRLSAREIPIVGHNVGYDLTMLHAELIRYGFEIAAAALLKVRPVIDTMIIEKSLDPYRPATPKGKRTGDGEWGKHTLVDACGLWGVPLSDEDAHGAAADALASGRLLWAMCVNPGRFARFDGYKPLPRISPATFGLEQLHEWQREKFAADAARFQSYKRGHERSVPDEVDPGFVAALGWPFQEAPGGWSPDDLPKPVA